MRDTTRIAFAALLVATCLLPIAASAEIYKCIAADGRVVFSGNPDGCPGAQPHELRGEVQTVPIESRAKVRKATSQARKRVDPTPSSVAPSTGMGSEALWRQRRASAAEELSRLQDQLPNIQRFVQACASGKRIYTRGQGKRQRVDCHEVGEQWRQANGRIADLHRYLDEGIFDECRRAGCVPGWVR